MERQLRHQARQMQEMLDRQRLLSRRPAEKHRCRSTRRLACRGAIQPRCIRPTIIRAAVPAPATGLRWQGGSELTIGDRVYLLHDYLRGELATADQSAVSRQARGLQLIPPAARSTATCGSVRWKYATAAGPQSWH